MGTVYKAEQDAPRRIVALKVIKPGVLSPDHLHRFGRETEVLGRLKHPGIAQIYDAGTAAGGHTPFFAMEYVAGRPLTRYAEAAQLDTSARLTLLAQVADAVHHAHQRGVIHRDLKPSNILVDETGQPKILDFGIARVTDSDVQATLQTSAGEVVGTLPYMSPEQIAADPLELDTRSDVYALGVILYELLARRLPIDVSRRNLTEAARAITDDEPAPLREADTTLDGDVERIVTKALEKQKNERYQSAADLAADIRRYLADEPIAARPLTALYQLRKFTRRHRALVGGAAATLAALVVGLVATGYFMFEARAERDRAEQEATKAVAINDFLQETLGSANPYEGTGREVSVLDALGVATEKINESFADQPEIRAAVAHTIGSTYRDLGEIDRAEPLLRSALEIRKGLFADPYRDVLESLNALGELFYYKRDTDAAEALWREALEIGRSLCGETHADVAEMLNNLGIIQRIRDDYPAAEAMLQEALAIQRSLFGDVHEEVANTLGNLATVHLAQSDYVAAEPLLRNALDISRTALGADHVQVGLFQRDLGATLMRLQRHVEAEEFLSRAYALLQTELGDYQETRRTVSFLVELYEAWDKPDQAAEYRALLAERVPTP